MPRCDQCKKNFAAHKVNLCGKHPDGVYCPNCWYSYHSRCAEMPAENWDEEEVVEDVKPVEPETPPCMQDKILVVFRKCLTLDERRRQLIPDIINVVVYKQTTDPTEQTHELWLLDTFDGINFWTYDPERDKFCLTRMTPHED